MDNTEEMQIKEDAPLFSRPSSPDRKYVRTLADIPEASPGPNAFAQQAARMDRHRLEGNAFYQQEVQKRIATPPTTVHPALRPRSKSDPPTPPRDSLCTTFSPFVDAGKEQKHDSPLLKPVPSDAEMAVPTLRGFIEERKEQIQDCRSSSKEGERIPAFVPAPKTTYSDFAKPATTPKKRIEKEASQPDLPTKTPKKGFFGRLKLTTNLRGTSSPSSTMAGSNTKGEPEENVPVKAQAVLGASPSKPRKSLGSSPAKPSIPRSPSKRKGFFSRKNAGLTGVNESTASLLPDSSATTEPAPLSASSTSKTPQTAISDPTHYSYQTKRIISQSNSDKGAEKEKHANQCAVARSQSLKYFDHSIPPTPPAKNTPPEEKARNETALAKKALRLPFYEEQNTPSRDGTGLISISGRVSPTRFGSYGHKEMPKLVTKPSVYSLHASVVPNMTEASTFEEMKARIDGLGLEGFNIPPENVRHSKLGGVYSPSIYSSDWATRPDSVIITPQAKDAKSPNGQSTHTKESSSSGGEIPICYPELAKDPSVNSLEVLRGGVGIKRPQSDSHLTVGSPSHGSTHSRPQSNGNSPQPSLDSAAFTTHVDDHPVEKVFDSPTSFNHPSATPSPLHLPRTVFTPPPRSTSRLQLPERTPLAQKAEEVIDEGKATGGEGLGIQDRSRSASVTPSKRNEVFSNAPTFPVRANYTGGRTPSPQDSGAETDLEVEIDVDPRKPSPKKSPSGDKLDKMIEILNKLNARNHEIGTIREEMRATNERLDQRLAAVETLHRASPAPSYALDETLSIDKGVGDADGTRIPTDVAHEFYRRVEDSESGGSEPVSTSDQTDSDTIAELKETNRRLLEMVGGFAEKIQALEKRSGCQR